jgi:hypothetical protein
MVLNTGLNYEEGDSEYGSEEEEDYMMQGEEGSNQDNNYRGGSGMDNSHGSSQLQYQQ